MFIYYDFESPDGSLIKNLGTAGATADLTNGKVFNGNLYYESITKQLRVPSKASMVSPSSSTLCRSQHFLCCTNVFESVCVCVCVYYTSFLMYYLSVCTQPSNPNPK